VPRQMTQLDMKITGWLDRSVRTSMAAEGDR
jgi:hypothetical protein